MHNINYYYFIVFNIKFDHIETILFQVNIKDIKYELIIILNISI